MHGLAPVLGLGEISICYRNRDRDKDNGRDRSKDMDRDTRKDRDIKCRNTGSVLCDDNCLSSGKTR